MSDTLNHPWDEVLKLAQELATDGHAVYQKFTCNNCGVRLTIDEANTFYTHGRCDQCDHVTDIRDTGCNYLLLISAIRNNDDRRITICEKADKESE